MEWSVKSEIHAAPSRLAKTLRTSCVQPARAGFPERCLCPPDSSSQFVEMVLQLNGGEPVFQIRQTARPIEFEAALRGAPGFWWSRLRQELDECLHLLLRQDGQSFIFGDQCVSAHSKPCYPQPAGLAIRHLGDSSGFNSPLSAISPPISDYSFRYSVSIQEGMNRLKLVVGQGDGD